MTLDEFITTTRAIIAEDGIDGYLPTLRVAGRWRVNFYVLTDVPSDVDVESFARDWATHVAGRRKDFFLAFRLDDAHVKVIHRHRGTLSERVEPVPTA